MNIGPCLDSIESRNQVVVYVTAIIIEKFITLNIANPTISQSGSFPLRTFLPEGDIDLSIFLPKE